ncbi:SET domain-containing protein [Favolaschia claudopus]|uniref:SET domain-containing protein n=1 Tax=Favolaschia claudopus TaxID=2862362 RepID=A0AAW0B7F6_9AGAR
MTGSNAVANLLSWCSERGFWIDERLRVTTGPCGVAVVSKDVTIPSDSILVRIPRGSVLSVKSCSISDLIPPHPYGRGAQLSLALALSAELAIGSASQFFPYLQSLPPDVPGMPLFWRGGAGPMEWLNGTEAWKMMSAPTEGTSLLAEIDQYFHQIALPVFTKVFESQSGNVPSLQDFHRAYALVSSRSFLVDAYHGLSMVPIADAFNHTQENHVHLESDFDVCPECGSLDRCAHDDMAVDSVPRSTISDHSDDVFEMVSNCAIPPNSEVFNTYGETLSNADLLVQYGFILDGNDNDQLTWTWDELAQFSENHLAASARTWDSIGGRAYFEDLLRSIISRPWKSISDSELMHLDHNQPFSLNGDATVSHGLWLYFASLLILKNAPPDHIRNKSNLIVLLEEIFQLQLTLEQDIAADEDLSLSLPPHPHGDERRRDSPSGVILELAKLLISLCRSRSGRTGRPGLQMTELGDILDSLPNDLTPTRMAISLALTERSLLDSCRSGWEGLASGLEGQGNSRESL